MNIYLFFGCLHNLLFGKMLRHQFTEQNWIMLAANLLFVYVTKSVNY
jgi:hypothetical protein